MCLPPAVVLRGCPIALAHSARSFSLALVDAQFQSVPLLPRPKRQNDLRSLRCWSEKQKFSYRDSPFRLSLPVDALSPSSPVVESSFLMAQLPPLKPKPRRSVARGGACLRARDDVHDIHDTLVHSFQNRHIFPLKHVDYSFDAQVELPRPLSSRDELVQSFRNRHINPLKEFIVSTHKSSCPARPSPPPPALPFDQNQALTSWKLRLPLTECLTYRVHLINGCISFLRRQFMSSSETGCIVSAHRLTNIATLILIAKL